MRTATVELALHRAWETWTVQIPDDLPSDQVEEWVREHFPQDANASLKESGANGDEIDSITEDPRTCATCGKPIEPNPDPFGQSRWRHVDRTGAGVWGHIDNWCETDSGYVKVAP